MIQTVNDLLNKYGLNDYAAHILPKVRPTLYLTLGEKGEGLGRTRIGGSPDLPPDFAWPTDEDGDPYTFAMQVNLGDIPAFDGNPFPAAGLLSVFANLDMGQTNRAGVFLFLDAGQCQRREQQHNQVNELLADIKPHHLHVVLGESLPMWATNVQDALIEEILEGVPDAAATDEDNLRDTYDDLSRALAPRHTVARLLGYAAGIGQDPREDAYVAREVNPDWLYDYTERQKLDMQGAEHWQHLLTIDSDDDLNLCIYDAGYWQILIKDSDLAALNFAEIYAAAESS